VNPCSSFNSNTSLRPHPLPPCPLAVGSLTCFLPSIRTELVILPNRLYPTHMQLLSPRGSPPILLLMITTTIPLRRMAKLPPCCQVRCRQVQALAMVRHPPLSVSSLTHTPLIISCASSVLSPHGPRAVLTTGDDSSVSSSRSGSRGRRRASLTSSAPVLTRQLSQEEQNNLTATAVSTKRNTFLGDLTRCSLPPSLPHRN
jgi:hypothetical protein